MAEITGIFTNIGLVLTAILGGFGVISLSIAALMYMNAHGDPQQVNKAKTAAIGAFMGLILGGMAWVLPGIVSRAIVEPSGGRSLSSSGGVESCDRILRSGLVSQRHAGSAAGMNELVSIIQNARSECRPDVWNPEITDLGALASATNQSCFDAYSGATFGKDVAVGNVSVPLGLRRTDHGVLVPDGEPARRSKRDRDNNILVYFDEGTTDAPNVASGRAPGDQAKCWMYAAKSNVWVSGSR